MKKILLLAKGLQCYLLLTGAEVVALANDMLLEILEHI